MTFPGRQHLLHLPAPEAPGQAAEEDREREAAVQFRAARAQDDQLGQGRHRARTHQDFLREHSAQFGREPKVGRDQGESERRSRVWPTFLQ